MIIPLGHEDQTVRRLPWVTFALVAINVILFLTIGRGALRADVRAMVALDEAASYWVEHPYLELDEAIREQLKQQYGAERFELIEAALDSPLNQPPEDPGVREREQTVLDQLVGVYLRARDSQPFLSWGLIPAQFSLVSLFASMFMHAGWLHLLGNMFILYLAAPSVEDAYGRPLFIGFYVTAGAVAALTHVALHPDSVVPLVGASGAIAGVMGAFLIRFSRTRIKFFYWFGLVFRGTFSAPAWLMLPLWLLEQLWYGSLTKSADGVAYWAHVGGFVFGAVAAYAIRAFKIEEQYIHPRIEAAISLSQHPGLEEGMALLEQRSFEGARESFRRVLADDPRSVDAHLGLWESYAQAEDAVSGAPHLVKVVENEVRAGDVRLAFDHWREGSNVGVSVPAALAFRLASQLAEEGSSDSTEVFRAVAHDARAGVLASKAASRLAELAPTDLERQHWQQEAARLEGGGAPGPAETSEVRSSVETAAALITTGRSHAECGSRSDATGAGGPPPSPPVSAVVPPVPPPLTRERSAGAAANAAEMPSSAAFPTAPPRVVRKPLKRLHPSGLAFTAGTGEEVVRYEWVEAVGVAGVSEGDRRYLLMDLILRRNESGSRTVVRMASSDFDPRVIMERPDLAPLEAFRELVKLAAGAARAPVLPDGSFLTGGAVKVFPSVADYERQAFSQSG